MADPDDVRRIVGNLVENAIVHNRAGGRVELSFERSGRWSAVRVADDGPGIPVAERERAFERFRRIGDGAPGSGLGLAIVRDLVAAAGGEVVLDGGADAGTVATVRLPAPA